MADNQVYHGKDVQVMNDTDVEVEMEDEIPQDNDMSVVTEGGNPVLTDNHTTESPRRSSRIPKPSARFLQMIAGDM